MVRLSILLVFFLALAPSAHAVGYLFCGSHSLFGSITPEPLEIVDLTASGTITAATVTDSTLSITGGNISSVGTVGATTVTATTITALSYIELAPVASAPSAPTTGIRIYYKIPENDWMAIDSASATKVVTSW
ncbi:MAG: hypothetical protein KAY24_01120 [Candidatus Eisenbacteria sp.]|nr:hypothetical protein [Candidatus Eisenbacteria bacterium]